VTVQATAARNLMRAVERANVTVDAVVLQSLAAAEAVLDPDERSLGVALLDLGGGTTDLAVFQKGSVRHSATIGYGGRSVSHDLSIGLRTPVEQAERIKIVHGTAVTSRVAADRELDVPGVGGRESRRIEARAVASIIEPRLTEILTLVRAELEREVDPSLLAGGVVLTGAWRSTRSGALAERVFRLPAPLGIPSPCAARIPGRTGRFGHRSLTVRGARGWAVRNAPGLIGRVAATKTGCAHWALRERTSRPTKDTSCSAHGV
jgi:cell division protein FtsA